MGIYSQPYWVEAKENGQIRLAGVVFAHDEYEAIDIMNSKNMVYSKQYDFEVKPLRVIKLSPLEVDF